MCLAQKLEIKVTLKPKFVCKIAKYANHQIAKHIIIFFNKSNESFGNAVRCEDPRLKSIREETMPVSDTGKEKNILFLSFHLVYKGERFEQ